jgi:protein O-mannosyl-transferase
MTAAAPAAGESRSAPPAAPTWRATWFTCALIVLATVAAYRPALPTPLIFDDLQVITANPSIRHLATALSPPRDGRGVTGRPLVNLSFALNYAISGESPWTYHATNVALHALAALALFGCVRRTFRMRSLRATLGDAAVPLAAATALLWALHPLQTESVTCIAQRTESMVGLLYLATLYGFIRAIEPGAARGWFAFTLAACVAGMATKEVMVTAPVILWLYDRTFVAGSFRGAWRQRRGFYAALAASWLLLAWLVIGEHGSRGSVTGAAPGSTVFAYALTQCGAMVRYAGLAVWPHPLVLDYDSRLVENTAEVALPAALLLLLLAATALGLRRNSAGGFVGAWCFVILAPSSSFVPLLPQPIAEHRMYLPLAALLAAALAATYRCAGRRALLAMVAGALALSLTTVRRNEDFRTAESIWRDTVAKQPANARAHFQLGFALEGAGRLADAIGSYEAALARHPGYAEARASLGRVLGEVGRFDDAVRQLESALALDPRLTVARKNLGLYLPFVGRSDEAVACLQAVLVEQPDDADAQTWLGDALVRQGHAAAAVPHYATAVQLQPRADKAETNWSAACLILGQPREAMRHAERALALNPKSNEARRNLGLAFASLGRTAEAAEQFNLVLRANPADAAAREQLQRLTGARRGPP